MTRRRLIPWAAGFRISTTARSELAPFGPTVAHPPRDVRDAVEALLSGLVGPIYRTHPYRATAAWYPEYDAMSAVVFPLGGVRHCYTFSGELLRVAGPEQLYRAMRTVEGLRGCRRTRVHDHPCTLTIMRA